MEAQGHQNRVTVMGAGLAGFAVSALGVIVLIGWALDVEALKRVAPGLSTMKANAALCFALSGLALTLAVGTQRRPILTRVLAATIAVTATLTLLEYAADVDLLIDRLLFYDPRPEPNAIPGRMSAVTAFEFGLFILALALRRSSQRLGRALFVAVVTLGLLIAFFSLSGYVYGLPLLYEPIPQSSIAVHTATGFLVLFAGAAALRPDLGWLKLLLSRNSIGLFSRWVLPAAVLLPAFVGWLILQGEAAGHYSKRDAMAIFTFACVIGFGALGWIGGAFANRLGMRAEAQTQVLRTVVETALDAFILMDEQGRIVDWNPEAERMFGYTRWEALGRLVMETVIPGVQRLQHSEGLARFLASGEGPALRRRIEVVALRRNGEEFPAELMILPARQNGAWLFSGFVRDLSDQKRAEAQLRQAQKMEAVGQLTGGVAHDFNNLLTVIIVSLDNAVARVGDEARAQLEHALHAAERGAALIRELLAFSRKQTLRPERLELNPLTQGMLGMLDRLLGERIELDLDLAPDPWPCFADRSQVETALLNLALNARDAMPEGGKLTIETANVTLDADYCRFNVEVEPGEYVMLAVSDSGVGMSADVIERAFEPFFTTKETGKGTGLGLSMIYGFAKQSQGHLKVYSEPGHGTTVRLYLPRARANQWSGGSDYPSAANEEPMPLARTGEVVLVVEDDADVRAVAVAQLKALGYDVLEAGDGAEAMAVVAAGTRIDLLFTDVVMPGLMTGRQLAEAAAAQRPALKTLFTSGYTDNSIVHHGRLDAGVHFLAKPYRARDLARYARAALDG